MKKWLRSTCFMFDNNAPATPEAALREARKESYRLASRFEGPCEVIIPGKSCDIPIDVDECKDDV